MTINRFNWDSWDIVVETSAITAGDIYRTDYKYGCSTEIPGTSAEIVPTPTPSTALSGCDLQMPPMITEFNMIPSARIEMYIYGNKMY